MHSATCYRLFDTTNRCMNNLLHIQIVIYSKNSTWSAYILVDEEINYRGASINNVGRRGEGVHQMPIWGEGGGHWLVF